MLKLIAKDCYDFGFACFFGSLITFAACWLFGWTVEPGSATDFGLTANVIAGVIFYFIPLVFRGLCWFGKYADAWDWWLLSTAILSIFEN